MGGCKIPSYDMTDKHFQGIYSARRGYLTFNSGTVMESSLNGNVCNAMASGAKHAWQGASV